MEPAKLRCRSCRILLATEDAVEGLSIRRGGMHATVPEARRAFIACYRCGKRNEFVLAAGRGLNALAKIAGTPSEDE